MLKQVEMLVVIVLCKSYFHNARWLFRVSQCCVFIQCRAVSLLRCVIKHPIRTERWNQSDDGSFARTYVVIGCFHLSCRVYILSSPGLFFLCCVSRATVRHAGLVISNRAVAGVVGLPWSAATQRVSAVIVSTEKSEQCVCCRLAGYYRHSFRLLLKYDDGLFHVFRHAALHFFFFVGDIFFLCLFHLAGVLQGAEVTLGKAKAGDLYPFVITFPTLPPLAQGQQHPQQYSREWSQFHSQSQYQYQSHQPNVVVHRRNTDDFTFPGTSIGSGPIISSTNNSAASQNTAAQNGNKGCRSVGVGEEVPTGGGVLSMNYYDFDDVFDHGQVGVCGGGVVKGRPLGRIAGNGSSIIHASGLNSSRHSFKSNKSSASKFIARFGARSSGSASLSASMHSRSFSLSRRDASSTNILVTRSLHLACQTEEETVAWARWIADAAVWYETTAEAARVNASNGVVGGARSITSPIGACGVVEAGATATAAAPVGFGVGGLGGSVPGSGSRVDLDAGLQQGQRGVDGTSVRRDVAFCFFGCSQVVVVAAVVEVVGERVI